MIDCYNHGFASGFKSRREDRLSLMRFLWFSLVHPNKFRHNALNWAISASFHNLFNSLLSIILSFDAIQSEQLKA